MSVGGGQDRDIIMFFMTFSGGRKTSMFHCMHRPMDARTYARTHVIALIHPCDSRQSEEGRRTPCAPFLALSLARELARNCYGNATGRFSNK